MCILPNAFIRSPRQFERAWEDAPILNGSRSTLSRVRSTQETCVGGPVSSTRAKAGSLTRDAPRVRTTLRRIGLQAITQNANQRTPNTIAAKTFVKKCAPNATRLNPTSAISNAALKTVSVRQCRVFIAGRTKVKSSTPTDGRMRPTRAEQISVNLGRFTMQTRPNEFTISRGSGRKRRLQKLGNG
jgi:hypothetical protein